MSYLGYNKRSKVNANVKIQLKDGINFEVPLSAVEFKDVNFKPLTQNAELPINYNKVIKGLNLNTYQEYQSYFRDNPVFAESPTNDNVICNSLVKGDNYDLLSTHNFSRLTNSQFRRLDVIEFYCLDGSIKVLDYYAFHSNDNLEVVSLKGCLTMTTDPFYGSKPKFRVLELPSLLNIPEGFRWERFPQGFNLIINKDLQNFEGSGVHPEIQVAINTRNANVTYV